MSDQEKKIKLGVDVGELANQILQISKLTENNYNISIKKQEEYNKILDLSLSKLREEFNILKDIASINSNSNPNGVNTSNLNGENLSNFDDTFTNISDFLEKILDIVDEIKNELTGRDSNEPVRNDISSDRNNNEQQDNQNKNTQQQNNRGNLEQGINRTASVAVQKNDVYMAAAVAAMIPIIGRGLGMIVQRIAGSYENLAKSEASYRAITGTKISYSIEDRQKELNSLDDLSNLSKKENLDKFDKERKDPSFSDIGLSDTDAIQKQIQYLRQNVRLKREDLYFEKGWGVDSGTMSSLLRSTRSDLSNTNAGRLGADYISQLSSEVGNKQARVYSDEYLKILVSLNEKQLESQGEVNTALNGKIIAALSGIDDSMKNPQFLAGALDKFYAGLSNASSPQVEALQYETLSQIAPNASLWQLEKMRQNPLENIDYLRGFIQNLAKRGTGEDLYFNASQIFGFKASDNLEDLINGILNGNLSNEQIEERYKKLQKENIVGEGQAATSFIEDQNAKWENIYANFGKGIADMLDKSGVSDKISKVTKEFEELARGTITLKDVFLDVAAGLGIISNKKKINEDDKSFLKDVVKNKGIPSKTLEQIEKENPIESFNPIDGVVTQENYDDFLRMKQLEDYNNAMARLNNLTNIVNEDLGSFSKTLKPEDFIKGTYTPEVGQKLGLPYHDPQKRKNSQVGFLKYLPQDNTPNTNID